MDQIQTKKSIFRIKEFEIHHKIQNKLQKVVPLNEKKIMIYFNPGDWILYNIEMNQIEKKGEIANNVKVFFQIWEGTLSYVDPDTLTVRLIDLNTGQINAGYEFPASHQHNAQSDLNTKETIAEKLLVGLTQYQGQRFLVTIEQQSQFAIDSPVIISMRKINHKYDNGHAGLDQVLFKYDYDNNTVLSEMFVQNTDPESLVLYGQDFVNGEIEFVLIKPHLGNQAIKLIKVHDQQSYILMNITNWINDKQIALWLNNDDNKSAPIIKIIDQRLYYDSENNTYSDEEVPWKAETVLLQYETNIPQKIVDVIAIPYGSQHSVIQRLVGGEQYISLIDLKNIRLVHEIQLRNGNYQISQDKGYIILYDNNQYILIIIFIDLKKNHNY